MRNSCNATFKGDPDIGGIGVSAAAIALDRAGILSTLR